MYHVNVKTDEGTEPVTRAIVVNFIKYDETDATELTLIDSMTKAARELLEQLLNVSLKQKTYQVTFDSDSLDDYRLRLPYGPYKDTFTLSSYDNEGTETALTLNTDFYLTGNLFKELYIPSPSTYDYYVAEFISGYGTGTETLPAVLSDAICKLVKFWYDRGEMGKTVPDEIAASVGPYSKQYWI